MCLQLAKAIRGSQVWGRLKYTDLTPSDWLPTGRLNQLIPWVRDIVNWQRSNSLLPHWLWESFENIIGRYAMVQFLFSVFFFLHSLSYITTHKKQRKIKWITDKIELTVVLVLFQVLDNSHRDTRLTINIIEAQNTHSAARFMSKRSVRVCHSDGHIKRKL